MSGRQGRRARLGCAWLAGAAPIAAPLLVVSRHGLAASAPPVSATPVAWPSPYVFWVENPSTTTPPLPEQCHGCGCLIPNMSAFIGASGLNAKFTECGAGAGGDGLVPNVRWTGPIGGPQDESAQTYALTVADLDYPYGEGSGGNHVQSLFWAANIPGDWTELSAEKLAESDESVVLGRAGDGALGMRPVCPERGKHRVRATIWAVRVALMGIGPDTPYGELLEQLEANELARATAFTAVAAHPVVGGGGTLLQRRASLRGLRSVTAIDP